MKNWIVRVYHDETIVETWCIANRTEQQATKEAMAEVEQHHPGLDWTMTVKED